MLAPFFPKNFSENVAMFEIFWKSTDFQTTVTNITTCLTVSIIKRQLFLLFFLDSSFPPAPFPSLRALFIRVFLIRKFSSIFQKIFLFSLFSPFLLPPKMTKKTRPVGETERAGKPKRANRAGIIRRLQARNRRNTPLRSTIRSAD